MVQKKSVSARMSASEQVVVVCEADHKGYQSAARGTPSLAAQDRDSIETRV